MSDQPAKNPSQQSKNEKKFESMLWTSRFIVLLAVVFGLIGTFSLLIIGSYDMIMVIKDNVFSVAHIDSSKIVGGIINAIDLYLIGVVTLLFSFGIYELFISEIDIARRDEKHGILEISNLDDLKNRILKVIIMVLAVSFFKQALEMTFTTSLEMLYLALAILTLAITAYFLHKIKD